LNEKVSYQFFPGDILPATKMVPYKKYKISN